MGSREPKHLSCPTHGAVWGTIYADGAVDYDCGCHAPPTPPAPADDKCWKCGGGVERTNTTLPGCDNDIFHDGQPPALPTEGAHPNGPVEGCPCHLCRYAFGEDSPADDASGAEAWARRFHDAYERLAPSFGYETRKETRQFDPSSPNGKLMIAVCAALPLPARDDAVEDAASVERAASKWIASEVDAYPGETMDDRIASWMRGGVHPDDVSRFLVDAYVEGYRAALARPRETTDAEAVRHAAAEIARAGAVAAYEAMAAAPRDGAQRYTYADCMEAVGKALDECEAMIRALPLPADDATKCHVCGRPATRHGPEPMCEDRWNGVTCALDSAIRRAHPADDASGAEAMRAALRLLKAPYGTPEWCAAGDALSRLAAPNGIRAAEAALPARDDAVEEAARALLDGWGPDDIVRGNSPDVSRLRAALRDGRK